MSNLDRYKFRGKRVDNGEWVCGSLLQIADGAYIDRGFDQYSVDPATVGQWTGKMVDGAELYEGDLILDNVGHGVVFYSEENSSLKVNYEHEGGRWSKHFMDFLATEWAAIEITGNIHDKDNAQSVEL
jgi:hypothetical protein